MVRGDMVPRLRLVLGGLAAATLLALLALSVTVTTDTTPSAGGDEAVVAVTGTGAARAGVVEETSRTVLLPVALVGFGVAFVGANLSAIRGLVGRRRRRIGDVGDSWRSLLLGAPPALA